jgi:biotin operon repressor
VGRSLRQIAEVLGVSKTAVASEVERLGLQRAA